MAAKTVKGNINFNTKHLKKGDRLPPFTGKLRIYNMRYCPYAHRIVLALNAKNIDYEVVNINLLEKPEWLTSKSAFGKVPALEIKEGVTIYESLVTVEYIDEAYPQRPLLPKDPLTKAFDKIIIEACGTVQTYMFTVLRSPDKVTQDNITAYHKTLDLIQDTLKSRGTKFLDGAEPGYADYMIWPWFERILMLKEKKLDWDSTKYKLLSEYFNNMLADPAVSQYSVPKEVFYKFLESYNSTPPNPDYDLLADN